MDTANKLHAHNMMPHIAAAGCRYDGIVGDAHLYSCSVSHLANGACVCRSVQRRPFWCSSSRLAVLQNLHQHAAA